MENYVDWEGLAHYDERLIAQLNETFEDKQAQLDAHTRSIDSLVTGKMNKTDIDAALSDVSEKPVQNKVIKKALDDLQSSLTFDNQEYKGASVSNVYNDTSYLSTAYRSTVYSKDIFTNYNLVMFVFLDTEKNYMDTEIVPLKAVKNNTSSYVQLRFGKWSYVDDSHLQVVLNPYVTASSGMGWTDKKISVYRLIALF